MNFDHIKIVLVETSHPGNIGATARAMKNMGFSRLALVKPTGFPSEECTVRASGADDILANAQVHDDLASAVADCELVYGTSARERKLAIEVLDPRQTASQVVAADAEVALVFGRERTGLSNEELAMCHYHIHIPTVETFSSLNLSQAVQVVCYELRMQALLGADQIKPKQALHGLANQAEMESFYGHLEATMLQVGFLDPSQPKKLLQRLRRLFNRTHLEKTEVNILRGFLAKVQKHDT